MKMRVADLSLAIKGVFVLNKKVKSKLSYIWYLTIIS